MSYQTKYALARPNANMGLYNTIPPKVDRMSAVSTLNRIAIVACERIMLLMNNTGLVKQRMTCMDDVMTYLYGDHEDEGLSGDRGDFYRRKMAEEIYTGFAVHGVTHENVMTVVMGAIKLERETRIIIEEGGCDRSVAPPVDIDDTILDILGRIANLN